VFVFIDIHYLYLRFSLHPACATNDVSMLDKLDESLKVEVIFSNMTVYGLCLGEFLRRKMVNLLLVSKGYSG